MSAQLASKKKKSTANRMFYPNQTERAREEARAFVMQGNRAQTKLQAQNTRNFEQFRATAPDSVTPIDVDAAAEHAIQVEFSGPDAETNFQTLCKGLGLVEGDTLLTRNGLPKRSSVGLPDGIKSRDVLFKISTMYSRPHGPFGITNKAKNTLYETSGVETHMVAVHSNLIDNALIRHYLENGTVTRETDELSNHIRTGGTIFRDAMETAKKPLAVLEPTKNDKGGRVVTILPFSLGQSMIAQLFTPKKKFSSTARVPREASHVHYGTQLVVTGKDHRAYAAALLDAAGVAQSRVHAFPSGQLSNNNTTRSTEEDVSPRANLQACLASGKSVSDSSASSSSIRAVTYATSVRASKNATNGGGILQGTHPEQSTTVIFGSTTTINDLLGRKPFGNEGHKISPRTVALLQFPVHTAWKEKRHQADWSFDVDLLKAARELSSADLFSSSSSSFVTSSALLGQLQVALSGSGGELTKAMVHTNVIGEQQEQEAAEEDGMVDVRTPFAYVQHVMKDSLLSSGESSSSNRLHLLDPSGRITPFWLGAQGSDQTKRDASIQFLSSEEESKFSLLRDYVVNAPPVIPLESVMSTALHPTLNRLATIDNETVLFSRLTGEVQSTMSKKMLSNGGVQPLFFRGSLAAFLDGNRVRLLTAAMFRK